MTTLPKQTLAQFEQLCQVNQKRVHEAVQVLVGRSILITGAYNGQPYGDSKPQLKGKVLKIRSAHVDHHGQVCVLPEGHGLYIGTDKFELVEDEPLFEQPELMQAFNDSQEECVKRGYLLKRCADFVAFVHKCVRRNNEYAPLHRQEMDELHRDLQNPTALWIRLGTGGEEITRLRDALQTMCDLWPDDMSDDGTGRMGFKPGVVATVKRARTLLNGQYVGCDHKACKALGEPHPFCEFATGLEQMG